MHYRQITTALNSGGSVESYYLQVIYVHVHTMLNVDRIHCSIFPQKSGSPLGVIFSSRARNLSIGLCFPPGSGTGVASRRRRNSVINVSRADHAAKLL